MTKPLVEVDCPLVVCMNYGNETSWKPKLINKMLSPLQEFFWHPGLSGGNCKQLVSGGMVEVAWYLPTNHSDNQFQFPVTFLNLREDARDSRLGDHLYSCSSATCIFLTSIDKELVGSLRKRTALDKLILVILYRKEDEARIKVEVKELQEKLSLEKFQIIRKCAEDANFNIVFDLLKKSIRHVTQDGGKFCSLTTLTDQMRTENRFDIDDGHGYHGQMAAKTILADIDRFNSDMPGSAKAIILPGQSDLKSRSEISSLEKELCRQKKHRDTTTVQKYAIEIKEKKYSVQINMMKKTYIRHLPVLFELSASF